MSVVFVLYFSYFPFLCQLVSWFLVKNVDTLVWEAWGRARAAELYILTTSPSPQVVQPWWRFSQNLIGYQAQIAVIFPGFWPFFFGGGYVGVFPKFCISAPQKGEFPTFRKTAARDKEWRFSEKWTHAENSPRKGGARLRVNEITIRNWTSLIFSWLRIV